MHPSSRASRKWPPVRAIAGWALAAAGAVAVLYALTSSSEGIPGWEQVNGPLQAALAGESSPAAGQPAAEPRGTEAPASSGTAAAAENAGEVPPADTAESSPAASDSLIDLNAATEAELDSLPGIGAAKAKAILAYRQEHGRFRSVEELIQVKGIGPKLLEQIRPFVRAGTAEPAPSAPLSETGK